MNTEKTRTIIACSMMEDELNALLKDIHTNTSVLWLDRGYHNTPEKLRDKLQELILTLQDQDEILLAFGLCGNGTAGLYSPHTALILPKFDDCLNMLLCRFPRTTRAMAKPGTIYMTRGWTLDQEGIIQQYEEMGKRYDDETREAVMEMMYEHYNSITLIDTGCYEMEPVQNYAKEVCELLDFSIEKEPGSIQILRELITGQWMNDPDNFIVKKPGESVSDKGTEKVVTVK